MLFKACGIRSTDSLDQFVINQVDLFGINFSPLSKRCPKKNDLEPILDLIPHEKQVFLFKGNDPVEVISILESYKPKYVQVYDYELLKKVPKQITTILACQVKSEDDLQHISRYEFFDILLLEGASSGKGIELDRKIDLDALGIPFILAGGLNEKNVVNRLNQYRNCIGADLASGIEENNEVSRDKITTISKLIKGVKEAVY